MTSKPDRVVSFWLVNGWMFILLFVVVFFMAVFGFFDYFVSSGYGCNLGDSFRCSDFRAYTDEKTVSFGDNADTITFRIENKQPESITNLVIYVENCQPENFSDKIFISGTEIDITVDSCAGMRPGYSVSENINLTYTVNASNSPYLVSDFGHVDVFVEGQKHESAIYKFKEWIVGASKKHSGYK